MAETKKRSNAEFLKWFRPVVEALKALGGSGTPEDVRQQIIKDMKLPESVTTETYGKSIQINLQTKLHLPETILCMPDILISPSRESGL